MRQSYGRLYLLIFGLLLQKGVFLMSQTLISNPSTCGLNLSIEDQNCPENGNFFNPNRFMIEVNNAPGDALGQDVYLKSIEIIIEHEWTGDLDIVLISPSGVALPLSSDNGGGDDNYGNFSPGDCGQPTIFDIGACNDIIDGEAPFLMNPYQPETSFYEFNDGSTPNGVWILQVCDDVESDQGTLQYVHLVFEPITCLPAIDIEIVNIDTTTATISWFPAFDCATTIVEVGPPGFTPGADSSPGQGQVFMTSCPPVTITGLAESTTYDVYIRKQCSLGNYSGNSCTTSLLTGCQPPPQTIVSTFDDLSPCIPLCDSSCTFSGIWENGTLDDLDWTVYNGPTPTLGTGPLEDVNGDGNYLYVEASTAACQNGTKAHLLSNCININKQGFDSCHLAFNYHMSGPNIGRLSLEATHDGGQSWISLWTKTGDQGNKWHKAYLDLLQFGDGTTVQFRFVAETGNGPKGDIAIDHIVFFGSTNEGTPPFQYFLDADNDGFGISDQFFRSCSERIIAGFSNLTGDCNDSNPNINPSADEVPCNGIDENCNSNDIDDDTALPPPIVVSDTICSGEIPEICATPNFGGFIYWFGSPNDFDFIDLGACLSPSIPENNTSAPITYRFYASERLPVCNSLIRAEATIVVYPKPSLTVEETPAICPGESINLLGLAITDGQFTGADITFHNGTPATEGNQITNLTVTPTSSTTYYASARTLGGCTDEIPIAIDLKPGPTLTFDPAREISVCKDGTTEVGVGTTDNSNTVSYVWNDGSTVANRTVTASFLPGNIDYYPITVTENTGCFTVDTLIVNTTNSIDSIRRQINDVTVCSGNDGSLFIEPLNGIGPYNYQWSGINGTQGALSGVGGPLTIDNLRQGSYRVTITDQSPQQCPFILRSAIVNGPNADILAPEIISISCPGNADGSITITAFGNDVKYLWNTGDTTASISNLTADNYSVTITETDCETVLGNLRITEPNPLGIIPNKTLPSCAEANDGELAIQVIGGTPPYQIQWANNTSTTLRTNLSGGNYFITVTDNAGCQLLDSINLNTPLPLTILTDTLIGNSCPGLDDAFIGVSVLGGTMPYSYQWSNGAVSAFNGGLSPDTYSLTVTDQSGCQQTATFTVNPTPILAIASTQINNPVCLGDSTGSIALEVVGGSPPYEFSWISGLTGPTPSSLPVGTYSVTIVDSRGCQLIQEDIALPARSQLSFSSTVTPPSCIGLNDGQIILNTGGVPPISYLWSNGMTSNTLNDIGVGTYGVTVEDAEGCLIDTAIVVDARQVFDVEFSVFQPNCYNSPDGVINVNLLESGQAPLSFLWNNGQQQQSLVGTPAGAYQLTVTDGLGCQFISDTFLLENPQPIQLIVDGAGAINCFGDSTAFIEARVEGGISPYTVQWPDLNVMGASVYNLPAGDYRLLIQDANECPLDTIFRFLQPTPLQARATVDVSGICEDALVNRLVGSATGGATPYVFSWNNGSQNSIIDQPQTGDYTLIVEDQNSCTDTVRSLKIKRRVNPLKIDAFAATNPSCFGATDASLTATISGGSSNYRFHFSNSYIVDTNLTQITTPPIELNRSYRVTVTDLGTGCVVVSQLATPVEPPLLKIARDSIQLVECSTNPTGAIFTTTEGGNPPYQYKWQNEAGIVIDSVADLEQVIAGRYSVIVEDQNGCTAQLENIEVPIASETITWVDSLLQVNQVNCFDGRNGAIDVTLKGGEPPLIYEWSNGEQTEDLRDIPSGVYQLTVTDANNCSIALPAIEISQPAAEIRTAAIIQNVRCAGENTGTLTVSAVGGSPPYLYSWKFEDTFLSGENSGNLDSLIAGRYYLIIRDTNKCIQMDSFLITEPPALNASISIEPPIFPGDNPMVEAIASGGVPPYAYRWNTGATNAQLGQVNPGEYRVTVTDENQCEVGVSTLLVETIDYNQITQIQLFPNPFDQHLYLDLALKKAQSIIVKLHSSSGQLIQQQRFPTFTSDRIELTTNELSSGYYLLEVFNEEGKIFSGRVIKPL